MIHQAVVLVRRHPDGIGPATPLAGLSVVGRLLHVLAEAGVRHAWVLGDLDSAETDAVLDLGIEVRLGVELVRRRERETETAAVARVSASAGTAVLLIQGDVVTSARTIAPLLRAPDHPLCRVVMRGDDWSGLAVLPHAQFVRYQALPTNEDALELMVRQGHATVEQATGPVRRLRGEGAIRIASRELYAAAQRGPEPDGPIARHLLRPAMTPVVAALLRLRVRPTAVTGAWLLLGLAAAVVFAVTGPAATALGAALLLTSGLLDYVDGALARLTHTAAPMTVLDTIGTDLVQATVLAGLTARSWGEIASVPTLVAGVVAVWLTLLVAGARHSRVLLLGRPRAAALPSAARPSPLGLLMGRLRLLMGRDVLLVLAVTLPLAGLSFVYVWYSAVAAGLGLLAVARYAFGGKEQA